MLTSISPLGERARNARWWRTATSYVAGSVLSGAAVGAVLGLLGSPFSGDRWPVVVAAVGAALAAALDIVGRLPTIRRQVDENWLHAYRDWVYGAGYGLQLGAGGFTIVSSAATYLVWLLELVCGKPALAAVIGAGFGLARALPLLTMAGVDDPVALRHRHGGLVAALPTARAVTVVGQAAAAVALAVVAGVG